MNYTIVFEAGQYRLRENPNMENPHPDRVQCACDRCVEYWQHLASLPCYPLLSMPSSWKEGDEIREDMVRKGWQVWNGSPDLKVGSWVTHHVYMYYHFETKYRRIVFTPAEQEDKSDLGVYENYVAATTSEQQGSGGEERSLALENDASNKILNLYYNMQDCPLKSFLRQWFGYYTGEHSNSPTTPAVPSPGVLDLPQTLKEFDAYFDALSQPQKDAGNLWIAFSDKWRAFKQALASHTLHRSEAVELLNEVMKYREGRGKYNFSHVPEDQQANEAFDAWQEIENKIKKFLTNKNK